MDEEQLIKKILDDFEVSTENELYETLIRDSNTIPCIICGKELSFDRVCFVDGDPYCKKHARNEE